MTETITIKVEERQSTAFAHHLESAFLYLSRSAME
jgi:hypothetical protein